MFKLKQNGIDGKLLDLLNNYLSNRRQRVVLNGKMSDWAAIQSGVPQGSVLGPLLFLIFINDLKAGIISQIKFFADDTSLYSVVRDPVKSAWELNHDLEVINDWAKQWKMSFNPDPTKPAEEILFSRKRKPGTHPPLFFNGIEVKRVTEHKHLGLILDPLLNFAAHFKEKMAKARKGIGLIKHLRAYLPTNVLEQIYKMHVRPHLDYCDFIYNSPFIKLKKDNSSDGSDLDDDTDDNDDVIDHEIVTENVHPDDARNHRNPSQNLNSQMKALESIQYQAALAVTGAWKGTSTKKIYEQLGWESLHHRRCFRRITQFYKIMNDLTLQYLLTPIPMPRRHLFGRHTKNDLYEFTWRTKRFARSFYPDSVSCWNALGPEIRGIESLPTFKSTLIKTIRPVRKSIFGIHDPHVRYIFQLRVGLTPLKAHKKRHGFKDTPDDTCRCGNGVETTEHFLLACRFFYTERVSLLALLNPFIVKVYPQTPITNLETTKILLYGDEKLNPQENKIILTETIKYIVNTERFC